MPTDEMQARDLFRQGLTQLIPEFMHESIARYLEHGIVPGSFLRAIFSNDFYKVMTTVDRVNTESLHQYALFLANFAPDACFGSSHKTLEWHRAGGIRGNNGTIRDLWFDN